MAACVFIVQGEGRGHLSQSMALQEHLINAGHSIEKVFVGSRSLKALPAYFLDSFQGKVESFQSPYFLRTPNKKGIYVGRTLLFNLTRSLIYLREVKRLRNEINRISPEVVFNFYDAVGASRHAQNCPRPKTKSGTTLIPVKLIVPRALRTLCPVGPYAPQAWRES